MDYKPPPSPAQADGTTEYHVMVCDDSSVVRNIIARAIEEHPHLHVTASVSDGQLAINSLSRNPVDVIVLDLEMPTIDGMTALPKLLAIDPAVRIIIASTLSLKNADISLRALNHGAADYIPKPNTRELSGAAAFKEELVNKVIAHAQAARKAGVRRAAISMAGKKAAQASARRPEPPSVITLRPAPQNVPDIIAIGSSTGGPQALFAVIKTMGVLPQPVIITQHMPPSFTTILAEHISRQCGVDCVEAVAGQPVEAGKYYLAPGDYHMILSQRAGRSIVTLTQDPPENFCRPAVDPMLRSASAIYGRKVLAVILTGMGHDGCRGSKQIVEAGGAVIAQDEASSVVWGMPGVVAQAGLCSAILPLSEIGSYVRQLAQGNAA